MIRTMLSCLVLLGVLRTAYGACGGPISTYGSTSFNSLDYPQPYQTNEDCLWTLSVFGTSVAVQLRFQEIDIDPYPSHITTPGTCVRHYLEIYEGTPASGTKLGTYCGNVLPPIVIGSGNTMTVKFITTGHANNGHKGFLATFSSVSLSSGPDSGCNNLRQLSAPSGSIASINYPADYSSGAQCEWEITVAGNKHVELTVLNFLVGGVEATCVNETNDYLSVYEGIGVNRKRLGVYCGWEAPRVRAYSNRMFVKFVSDDFVNYKGFFATYRSVDLPTTIAPAVRTTDPLREPGNTVLPVGASNRLHVTAAVVVTSFLLVIANSFLITR
ncbi:procollagen C-endopeptidase enhancer 2-like [Branchiostoma lanceolatum]|uniref:procollagen C-endopeptidase enhancer 2-like n=1 Tax=Branchiostoma lanceolatum TaxID=7740 RepID=UPI00345452D6